MYVNHNEICPVCRYHRFIVQFKNEYDMDCICPMCGYRVAPEYPDLRYIDQIRDKVRELTEEEEDEIYKAYFETGHSYLERVFLGFGKKEKDDV